MHEQIMWHIPTDLSTIFLLKTIHIKNVAFHSSTADPLFAHYLEATCKAMKLYIANLRIVGELCVMQHVPSGIILLLVVPKDRTSFISYGIESMFLPEYIFPWANEVGVLGIFGPKLCTTILLYGRRSHTGRWLEFWPEQVAQR